MKKSMVLFVSTILLLSAVLGGCLPGRRGPGRLPHPPVPHHR